MRARARCVEEMNGNKCPDRGDAFFMRLEGAAPRVCVAKSFMGGVFGLIINFELLGRVI